jgi:hypothetical protein
MATSIAPCSRGTFSICSTKGREPTGEFDAAGWYADQRDLAEIAIALDDLVRDAPKRALDSLRIEQKGGVWDRWLDWHDGFLGDLAGSLLKEPEKR